MKRLYLHNFGPLNINQNVMDISFRNDSPSSNYNYGLADRYLPIRLTTTEFRTLGNCMAFLANNADGSFTDIIENEKSDLFIISYNLNLYEEIKSDILNMDFWEPSLNFQLMEGEVDGTKRKIYLDIRLFNKLHLPPKKPIPHTKTITQFYGYKSLYPFIAYVSEDFNSIFTTNPMFESQDGFHIENNSIYANIEDDSLFQYNTYCSPCVLKGHTLFYDRYEITNIAKRELIIYSKEGYELIRNFFYDTSDYASKIFLTDKVVGAITILDWPPFENKVVSMTIFLMTELFLAERATNIDMETNFFENHPIKFLKYQKTKVLTLAAIYYILKRNNFQLKQDNIINYENLGGWEDFFKECEEKGIFSDFSIFFSMDKTRAKKTLESVFYQIRTNEADFKIFENFIKSHFENMDTFDQEVCSFILPDLKNKILD